MKDRTTLEATMQWTGTSGSLQCRRSTERARQWQPKVRRERPFTDTHHDVILNGGEAGVKDRTTLAATMQWTGMYR